MPVPVVRRRGLSSRLTRGWRENVLPRVSCGLSGCETPHTRTLGKRGPFRQRRLGSRRDAGGWRRNPFDRARPRPRGCACFARTAFAHPVRPRLTCSKIVNRAAADLLGERRLAKSNGLSFSLRSTCTTGPRLALCPTQCGGTCHPDDTYTILHPHARGKTDPLVSAAGFLNLKIDMGHAVAHAPPESRAQPTLIAVSGLATYADWRASSVTG
jgi:hypothetical protein